MTLPEVPCFGVSNEYPQYVFREKYVQIFIWLLLLSGAIVYCHACNLINLSKANIQKLQTNLGYNTCPKISNTLFIIHLAFIFLFMQLFLNLLTGMANCVDPDLIKNSYSSVSV